MHCLALLSEKRNSSLTFAVLIKKINDDSVDDR